MVVRVKGGSVERKRDEAIVGLLCCCLLKVLFANALIYLQLSNALLPLT